MAESEYERDDRGRFGSGPGGGTATVEPDSPGAGDQPSGTGALAPLSERAQQNIGAVEGSIRGQSFETGACVKPDGTPVLRKDGESNRVEFTPVEADAMRGGVFTHNHPNGSSFSVDDVRMGSMLGLAEMRVATRDGTTFRIQPTPGRPWPSSGEVLRTGNFYRQQVGEALIKAVDGGRATREEANGRWLHETWTKAAPALGLVYSRE